MITGLGEVQQQRETRDAKTAYAEWILNPVIVERWPFD